jgi:tetratricopeptide (TPR) repeat protein
MHLRRMLEESCTPCVQQYDSIMSRLTEFRPGDWIDWVQLATSVIGILWIIYQFNRLRRNAEKELEEYLERHLEQKLRDFRAERVKHLLILNGLHSGKGLGALLDAVFAIAKRIIFAISRWIPIIPNANEVQYAFATLEAGSYDRAKSRFETYGTELLDLADKYEKQANIKRLEAANVFLYAGCVAATSKDEVASIVAFKKVLDLDKNDIDAHERIGLEYLRIESLQAALYEFHAMKELAKEDLAHKAEAYRLSARVHKLQSQPVLARRELQHALDIETERKDPSNIGRTLEMLGDLYRTRHPRFQNAAISYYRQAIESYKAAGDFLSVSRIEPTIWDLTGDQKFFETFASRLLNRMSEGLRKLALKLRVRDHTKSDKK